MVSQDYLYTLNVCGPVHASACSQKAPNTAACQTWSGGYKELGSATAITVAPMEKDTGVIFTLGDGEAASSCGKGGEGGVQKWATMVELQCDPAVTTTPTLKLLGVSDCVARFIGYSAVACPITPPKPPIIPEVYSFTFAVIAGASPLEGNTAVGAVNVDSTRGLQRVDEIYSSGITQSSFYFMKDAPYMQYNLRDTRESSASNPSCDHVKLTEPAYLINPALFDKATLTAEELFRGVMSYQWKLATSNASSVSYAYVSATLDPYLVGTQTLDTKKGTIMSETHIFGFINQLPTNPYLFQPPPICQATP